MLIQRYHDGSTARLALMVACAAQLLVVVDISVVNIALPTIQADLAMTETALPWVAMAYSLGFAGVLLVGARLADVLGTVRVLTWGVAAFTLASFVGGLAGGAGMLIGARAVQGLAAAVVAPATLTLLTRTHPEGPARVRGLAWWTAAAVAGGGLGNITSGLLTELVSWRAVLLVNVLVGLCIAAAARALARRVPDPATGVRVDLTGAVLATAGFSSATYALSLTGRPDALRGAAAAGALAVVLLIALVLQQRGTASPLVPPALLRTRGIRLGNAATALTAMAFQVSLWYFLTFRMQDQMGYSALQAGLAFLPLTASMIAVNTWVTPWLLRRWSAGRAVVLGATLSAAGLLAQAVAPSAPFLLAVLVPTLVVGAGGGLLNTPLATIVTSGVRGEHAGAASGLMNTSKQLGGAVGLAAGTAVASALGTNSAAFAGMAAIVAVVALLGVRLSGQHRPTGAGSAQSDSERAGP